MAGNYHLLSRVYRLLRKEASEINLKDVFLVKKCHQAFQQQGIALWTKPFSTVKNKNRPLFKKRHEKELLETEIPNLVGRCFMRRSCWKLPVEITWDYRKSQLLGFMTWWVPATIFHLCCIHGEAPRLYPRSLTQLCPRFLSRLCPRPFECFVAPPYHCDIFSRSLLS